MVRFTDHPDMTIAATMDVKQQFNTITKRSMEKKRVHGDKRSMGASYVSQSFLVFFIDHQVHLYH